MWKPTVRWHKGKHPCIRGYYHFLDSIVEYVGITNIQAGRYGTARYRPHPDIFRPTIYDPQKRQLKIIAKGNGFFENIFVRVEPDCLLMILLLAKYYPDTDFLHAARKEYIDKPEAVQRDFGRFYPHPLEPYLEKSFSEFNTACHTSSPDPVPASLDRKLEPESWANPHLPLEELAKSK